MVSRFNFFSMWWKEKLNTCDEISTLKQNLLSIKKRKTNSYLWKILQKFWCNLMFIWKVMNMMSYKKHDES